MLGPRGSPNLHPLPQPDARARVTLPPNPTQSQPLRLREYHLGLESGAVKGQRPTPSVVGKDAARSHTSQEVGPGFRDPGSDLTSLGGSGRSEGLGRGCQTEGRGRHWAPSLCPLRLGSGGLQVSLRGQGEGRHRRGRGRRPRRWRGYDDEEDEEEGGRGAPAGSRAQVPAHPAPAWGARPSPQHMGASKLTVRSPQAEASAAASMPSGWGREGRAPGTQHTLSSHPGSSPQLPSRGRAKKASPGRGQWCWGRG